MKKNKEPKKVVYYSDPLNDDFAGTKIKQKKVDKNFNYFHRNFFWRMCSWLCYYFIAYPLIWFYMRIIMGIKVKYVDKKSVKKLKSHYFLYGNHTSISDTYIPAYLTFPHRNKIIASADSVSLKGLAHLVQMLGGLPVPNTVSGLKNFTMAINYYFERKNVIAIYPEAHIWPFYNDIRPFPDTSFNYPVKLNAPVVAFVMAYSKTKSKLKKAKRTIYISKPFYPNSNLTTKDARKDLRDRVYNWQKQIAKDYSTYAYIEYLPKEQTNTNNDNTK